MVKSIIMEQTQRDNWLDTAKGIAMILVLIGHAGSTFGYKQWNLGFVGGFHLAIFFLVCGYKFKKEVIDKEYISKKFMSLMTPYFLTCIAITIISVVTEIVLNHDASILATTKAIGESLIASFFASAADIDVLGVATIPKISGIWFLPAMFFAIIIFQFILNKLNTTAKRITVSVAIGLAGYVSARFIYLPFSIQSAMFAVPFVCAGYEIKINEVLEKVRWWHYALAGAILIAGIGFGYCKFRFGILEVPDLFFSTIVAFAGSLLVYLLAKCLRKVKIINYIGRITTYILCAHLVFFELGEPYFRALSITIIKDDGKYAKVTLLESAINICIQVILSIALAALIDVVVKKYRAYKESYAKRQFVKLEKSAVQPIQKQRDKALDVLRGLFIIAMIVGHFGIDSALAKTIYSCHMAAFVVVSGYFFDKEKSIKETLKSSAKTLLIPYAVFAVIQILINIPNWSGEFFLEALKKYTAGVILTKDILTSVQSIGPAWFILMLFVVRMLYVLIQKICKKEWIVTIVVIALSIVGVAIGKAGYWLPWSVDIALYALVFYQAGHLFKKFNILEYMKGQPVFYFALTPVWAYMIFEGSVELSRRNYGSYGLAIVGSLEGILTTYILSTFLVKGCPVFSNILATLGKASMYILLVHTLIDEILRMQLIKIIPQGNIAVMIIALLVELVLSWAVYKVIELAKTRNLHVALKN